MFEKIVELACRFVFFPHIKKVEREIGYKLMFRDIPKRFIDGMVRWDMTALWRRYGLDVEAGTTRWTIGRVVEGLSTRYDRNAPEYQAWLGGYIVKLPSGSSWTPEDHVRLAVADQNSWVNTYGGPHPSTSIEGFELVSCGPIRSREYSGMLYETACMTYSDVGNGRRNLRKYLSPLFYATFFNLSNTKLRVKSDMMVKRTDEGPYEKLKLRAYFALFDLEDDVYVVLYGNGAIVPKEEGNVDTFPIIKDDLLHAMRSCEIVKI